MSPTSPAPAAAVEWRLAGPPLLLRLVPLAAVAWLAVTGLLRLLEPGRQRDGGDTLLLLGYLLLLAGFVAALVVTARSRVRVGEAGVEVRETSTRLYRWDEIRDVRADAAGRPRWAVLELDDGRRRVLPVPSGALRRAGDTTVADAVQLIRRRHQQHRPRSG